MPEFPFILPDDPQPRWADAEQTKINCLVIFPHLGEEPQPYTAAASDPGWEHSEKIFQILANEDLGIPVDPYIPPPPPPPSVISDRQFAHELRARGMLTQAEALAFVSRGEIPTALQDLIAALPTQEARDDAELLIAGATVFERNHPLTATLASGFGWTAEQTDDFFRAAAAR